MYNDYFKRCLSVMCCTVGLLLFWWVYAAIAIAVFIDDPGPIFFRQKRVAMNKNGETQYFQIMKFRSMKMSTPHDVPTHLLDNPDQYITKVGKILRKYSLDELPQIFNVLAGDMALVGPRPALWNQYDLIEEREKYGANDVRPGITGWAQIHGRDELEISVKAELDGYYASHMGLLMDLRCLFGTILPVLRGDGVVEGGTGELHKKENQNNHSAAPRKKLLAVTNHSYMFWQFRRELMEALMAEYEVVISTPFVGHEDDFEAMGCRMIETDVDRRSINPVTDLKLFVRYLKMLHSEKPDMVITYSIKPNIYAGTACQLLNIPYCVNVQGLGTAFQKEPLASVVSLMYRIACRKAKVVFFENQGNAQVFIDRKIVEKEKIKVLPGAGVNLNYYSYAPYPKHQEIRFLYLGRIMKEKGMDELFYAIRKLYDEFGDYVHLDLVGFFEDEYKEQVEQLVDDGIATFYGFQEDPRPFYANADCAVLPSYHEGMSNVLLEAAATGRCIVTSNIPGCREAVINRYSGLLCKVQSKESLYSAMHKVTELNKSTLEIIGKVGRKKVEKEFSKNSVVEQTIKSIK